MREIRKQLERLSTENCRQYSLRARWLFPISAPPIAHGCLSIAHRTIVAAGAGALFEPVVDLGDVALLPALVNAHTHLEFSDLATPLGARGMPLPQWIPAVIEHAKARGVTIEQQAAAKVPAVAAGLAECTASGTGVIADISSWPWPRFPDAWQGTAAHVTVFLERLGTVPGAAGELCESIAPMLADDISCGDAPGRSTGSARLGLSPHAPYSTSPPLVQAMAQAARLHQLPLAVHLAESREELQLLASRDGAFADMLGQLGPWQPGWLQNVHSCLDVLKTVAQAPRVLVAHGNYLDDQSIAFLARHRERMSVVYCPRTHDYFQHAPYPLRRYLDQGVRVVFGTDSRASNPDLNMWNELRFVAPRHPNVTPSQILESGILEAARALGCDDRYGSLAEGKTAVFAVVALEDGDTPSDPYEMLLQQPQCEPLVCP